MFKKSTFAIVTLLMVLSIVMLACGGSSGLNGTWVTYMEGLLDSTEMIWTFSGNNLTQEVMGMRVTMPYSVRGNNISMNYEGMDVELPYRIDGNRLIVDLMGYEMVFTKR